ncbi:MAG: hypothetical protein M5U28_32995 [Sandaracinaceae bacterium]|nr:hypothetical protein [Sandaracinaceae bacterium]
MKRRARELAVLVLLACAPALDARAHLGHAIARAERYLKLDVAGHEGARGRLAHPRRA